MQLQELTLYNTSILQHLSQYVIIFNQQFDITYCSKTEDLSRLLFPKNNVELLSQNLLDLPFEVETDVLKRKLEYLMRRGVAFSLSDVKLEESSQLCVVNMFFSPFSSSRGELLGGLLLVDDVTRDYEMRQRLIDAEKFSLIGSMASMITHEVNNPLDGVMRLINLSLAQIDNGDPVREYLTEAQKGVQRIASLIGSLLGFSRRSMSMDAEIAPLDVIIENAVSIIQRRNEEKNISIDVKLAPVPLPVRTNDFYQLISNLLSNACDAITSDQGNVRIEVRADDRNLCVIVEDDGCGIPENMQSQIFEAFWTTKEYGKGTGLGLAIVKKLVDLYDGTIIVESRENVGTKVELAFPHDRLIS
jgi:signal transduction histidine kinase